MTITITPAEGDRLILAIEGAMTVYEATGYKKELLDALADGSGLEFDLSAVDELDTAGLQLLVLAHREGIKAGKTVRVVSRSAEVLEALDRYGLRPHFDDGVPGAH
jgi:anti-sigma B factor antagonist